MKRFLILAMSLSLFLIPVLSYADAVVIAPYAFLPSSDMSAYGSGWSWLNVETTSSGGTFMAPVYIPDGKRITSVVLFYYDNSATGNIQVDLVKYNIYTQAATIMVQYSSSGASTAYQNQKMTPISGGAIVNNGGYAYLIRCYFSDISEGDAVKFHKAKILFQ